MNDFEKWKDRYDRHWCTKAQLKMLVNLEVLSAEDYEEITGDVYES